MFGVQANVYSQVLFALKRDVLQICHTIHHMPLKVVILDIHLEVCVLAKNGTSQLARNRSPNNILNTSGCKYSAGCIYCEEVCVTDCIITI